jgi:hypothetical protein
VIYQVLREENTLKILLVREIKEYQRDRTRHSKTWKQKRRNHQICMEYLPLYLRVILLKQMRNNLQKFTGSVGRPKLKE